MPSNQPGESACPACGSTQKDRYSPKCHEESYQPDAWHNVAPTSAGRRIDGLPAVSGNVGNSGPFPFTPPRYDAVYEEGMKKLDKLSAGEAHAKGCSIHWDQQTCNCGADTVRELRAASPAVTPATCCGAQMVPTGFKCLSCGNETGSIQQNT
jgi:hypothetical protein